MIDFPGKSRYDTADFRRLVHLLRQKDGCPWDRVQTHHSIRDNFLEEAYEACEAIDNDDPILLREELGDVLLQVLFHASIEEDAGRFDLDDVADAACKKLIFRHPNLFDQPSGEGWAELKRREKGFSTQAESLDAVARSLPALRRSEKIQQRAAEVGFDWGGLSPALDKLSEEVDELTEVKDDTDRLEEELGDLLFSAVAVARHGGIDPERALHRASDKFIRRFARAEALADDGMSGLSERELVALWRRAKAEPDA